MLLGLWKRKGLSKFHYMVSTKCSVGDCQRAKGHSLGQVNSGAGGTEVLNQVLWISVVAMKVWP